MCINIYIQQNEQKKMEYKEYKLLHQLNSLSSASYKASSNNETNILDNLIHKYDILNLDLEMFKVIYNMDNAERKDFFEFNNSKRINILNAIPACLTLSSLVLNYISGISGLTAFSLFMFLVTFIEIIIIFLMHGHRLSRKRKLNIIFYRYFYLDTFNLKHRNQYFYEKS